LFYRMVCWYDVSVERSIMKTGAKGGGEG